MINYRGQRHNNTYKIYYFIGNFEFTASEKPRLASIKFIFHKLCSSH